MFLDEAVIEVKSGKGGDGAASFRKEKHVPRGGPDGGDGGNGGDVIIIADSNLTTLLEYRYTTKFAGVNGADGQGDRKYGKTGKSVKLTVPVGTVVKDADSGEVLADLTHPKARYVAAKGGRGGKGNLHFVSSVRQAPSFAEKGEPGEERKLLLELRLMADVGLVGLPNAGKSTLISAVSRAKPRIADYPFTTLVPNLGIAKAGEKSFVIADLPGMIEGASAGKGLGLRFLKHAERTRVILHVVECEPLDESDPIRNYELILRELHEFSKDLAGKPSVIALSKIDLMPDEERLKELAGRFEALGQQVYPVSAATNQRLEPLMYRLAQLLDENPPEPAVEIVEPKPESQDEPWGVEKRDDAYVVTGKHIVRMVAMTQLDNDEALRHLHRRLKGAGVLQALKEAGAEEGDTVTIGKFEFTYLEED